MTIIIFAIILLVFFILLTPKIRNSAKWQATVTPLASIIGSGFLVSTPLLILSVGKYAVVATLGIITLGCYWHSKRLIMSARLIESKQ